MKFFNVVFLLMLVVAFTSCEDKKTRAEIEADFGEYNDSASAEGISTSVKRSTSMSDGDRSLNGSLADLEKAEEQKAKAEETKVVQPVSPEANTTETTIESDINSNTVHQSETAVPNGNVQTQQTEKATAPAKTAEPVKATEPVAKPAEPARQQSVVQKSEPGKRDVIVDGQAQ